MFIDIAKAMLFPSGEHPSCQKVTDELRTFDIRTQP